MENATKALLIAAAVLVVILIISLGVAVYRKASESMGSMDLSEYEITQFNEKFTKYKGNNVSGSDVNALLQTAFNHNNTQESTTTCVSVIVTRASGTTYTPVSKSTNLSTIPEKLSTGARYKVEITINTSSKLVDTIKISPK